MSAHQESGKTALFFVASSGKEDLVGKMLERGADPDVQDNVRLSVTTCVPWLYIAGSI